MSRDKLPLTRLIRSFVHGDTVNSWRTGVLCIVVILNVNAPSVLKLTPPMLDFGSIPVGTTSPPKIATLINIGNSALTVRDISVSGIDFAETNTCPSTLPAGGTCAIEVTFKPAIDGPRIGTIMISTSDPASPQFLVLTGTGQSVGQLSPVQ